MERYIKDNDNRLMYHAMVAMLDDVVGNITAGLEQAASTHAIVFVINV